jgi:hypothetical protein
MWNGPVVAKVTTRKITSVCVLNHANSIVTKKHGVYSPIGYGKRPPDVEAACEYVVSTDLCS